MSAGATSPLRLCYCIQPLQGDASLRFPDSVCTQPVLQFSSVFFSRPRPILVVSARQCVTSTGTLKAARQYYQPARWPTRWGRVSGYFRRKTPTCETTAASEHVSDL